ncbi:cullin-3-A-like [Symsagittifera roscoffensis]|uniref:cullin-3-A-like n=1 Tax=Symsagittifera roscoffensis TaxID=84072 RepID=UPI00307CAA98
MSRGDGRGSNTSSAGTGATTSVGVFGTRGGSRKDQSSSMRIKAFPMNMDDQLVDNIWKLLRDSIIEIQKKNNSGLSFEELYRNAYTMVLHKHGVKLYNGLQETVIQHLRDNVLPEVKTAINHNFLSVLNVAWQDHTTAMVMIRDILMYMDRAYVQQNKLENVYNLGLILFREQILKEEAVKKHLRETLMLSIERERRGEMIDRAAIKNACTILMNVGIYDTKFYEDYFEIHFLKQSKQFYQLESQELLAKNSASEYIHRVQQRMQEEMERAQQCFAGRTESEIQRVMRDELIKQHMNPIVEMPGSGVVFMLKNQKIADLRCLYQLLKQVDNGLKTICTCISNHLREEGKTLVAEENRNDIAVDPVQYVTNLLELKDKYNELMEQAFDNDKQLKQTVNGDFEHFVNLNSRSPEYLSLYVDDKFKKVWKGGGLRAATEETVEQLLDKVMVIFRFLNEKDIFERYYKQHLSKRLLSGKSAVEDHERTMISKLKTECGSQFTGKLEGMFKDISVSTTLNESFKRSTYVANMMFDFHVKVLTSGNWPSSVQSSDCMMPPNLEQAFECFRNFYLSRHSGRKLIIQPNKGSADIKATFYPTDKDMTRENILIVTTYQMVILLLFNRKDRITFADVLHDTGIPEREAARALQAIAVGKPQNRILVKTPKTKEIEPTDSFCVNDDFYSKLFKIRVTNIQAKESEPETKETREKVEDDRKHEIEAAIVRIMKSRRQLVHNQLVSEVTEQLKSRFKPIPQVIKKRIENLIERDYLARDRDDSTLLHYVA